MSKETLIRLAQGYERKTALSPICWIIGVLVVATVNICIFVEDVYVRALFAVFDIAALIFAGKVYWHILISDPDRLHSEKFILEHQKMKLEAEKNKKPAISDGDDDIMETDYKEVQ